MPDIAIIQLIPAEPMSAADFTIALEGLVIRAFDISFDNPEGTLVRDEATEFLPDNLSESRIAQHYIELPTDDPLSSDLAFQSVATAIIEIENNSPEYEIQDPDGDITYSVDLRLEIERNGREIPSQQIYYNCPVITVDSIPEPIIPEPDDDNFLPDPYASLTPVAKVAIYLSLPAVGRELDPDTAFVDLSREGPPPFSEILSAVDIVLNEDPGGNIDSEFLRDLTAQQCLHIANEIVCNPVLNPPPELPIDELRELYTGTITDEEEGRRQRFEGELKAYEAACKAKANRLANFIFALSSAINSELLSREASRVGFNFPVHSELPEIPGKIKGVEVILTGPDDGLVPPFVVPAPIFYALGVVIPLQVTKEQRHKSAILEPEEQILDQLEQAIDTGLIADVSTAQSGTETANANQAARRLVALGKAIGTGTECPLTADSPEQDLVEVWLDFAAENTTGFWEDAFQDHALGHLNLVLCAFTENHEPLSDAIRNDLVHSDPPITGITNISELSRLSTSDWQAFFASREEPPFEDLTDILPPFTQGTPEQRIQAFINHARAFFDVPVVVESPDAPTLVAPPSLPRPMAQVGNQRFEPFARFIEVYNNPSGLPAPDDDFAFGFALDEFRVRVAAEEVFPDDLQAQAWLSQAIASINDLFRVTDIGLPEPLRHSYVEALWSKGFDRIESILEYDLPSFQTALTGSVAWQHASNIFNQANTIGNPPTDGGNVDNEVGFRPINSDCCLVNCLPPPHLSPLGPFAYLSELINLSEESTCDETFPVRESATIMDFVDSQLSDRCHDLNNLLVTQSNLEVPLPLVDLVNECLEAIASVEDPDDPNDPQPPPPEFTHSTNTEELAGHTLCPLGPQIEAEAEESAELCHQPATLFCAVPEHSSPATPVAFPNAYENLKNDFSKPSLPYSQQLDICRTYLEQLSSSRYTTMRTFRKEIWSFVLDPNNEPDGFPRHLWRYPVRRELACEYLRFTPEECDLLFTQDIVSPPTTENPFLFQLYGFRQSRVNDSTWTVTVRNLCEFLKRTELTFCEFIELQDSEFVRFILRENGQIQSPRCEPCNLDDFTIEFQEPSSINESLKRLAVFIRLWRRLQQVKGAQYSFKELRDICEVLQLFDAAGTINPDFIEQLAAFQMLRDQFGLALVDETDPQPSLTGADRTHLLALWTDRPPTPPPTPTRWDWAINHVLDKLQPYAQAIYHCKCRPPDFIKLLRENLDPLSRLMGFDPDNDPDTWHARPTHTLRFAELLAKLYASEFGVGELFFLFTTNEHLHGDDPFALQPLNEALGSPLGLPDDEDDEAYLQDSFSLWALRYKLLAVEVSEEEVAAWTWPKIVASLEEDFAYDSSSDNHLQSLGEHFFPMVLEAEGTPVPLTDQQYRTGLTAGNTAPQMWNTIEEAAFRYNSTEEELWVQLPLTDEGVIQEMSRIRQINTTEQFAIQRLYFLPRLDLVPFAFIFPSFAEADQHLIQEADENERWQYFQHAFALCHKRCRVIAEHLASHVEKVTGQPNTEGDDRAWLILKHLYADENEAFGSWENNNGLVPNVRWPKPSGGAFTALLGVMGTGLLGEISDLSGGLIWREVRGPMVAFSAIKNAWNAPVPPTRLPDWNFSLPPEQGEWVTVRNGYALANPDGTILGGAQGFQVTWQGLLLIEQAGDYSFQVANFEAVNHQNWRVIIQRGQKTIELLSHNWPNGDAPPDCSTPVILRRGTYELTIELERPQPEFNGPEDLCPLTTGFALEYCGADTDNDFIVVPLDKLFIASKEGPLGEADTGSDLLEAGQFLGNLYIVSIRDIRRTFIRAFSALLFTHRYELSAQPTSDTGESELGYMLRPEKQDNFAGQSYFRDNGDWNTHLAFFNFNFLPVLDNYFPPDPSQDLRADPSVRRRQAFFDWWERMFDYVHMRQEARRAPEYPVWLLFHEAAELHEDNPAHLVRHMGVPLDRAALVLRYFEGYDVTSEDLEDDRWAVRVWWAEKYLRNLLEHFLPEDIRDARPDLWAADDPIALLAGETGSGNQNLTQFYRYGCIENGEPRRYTEIEHLNNGLRDRARLALIAYLISLERVTLPWGGFAETAKDLSEFLLMDVEAGICQKASRAEAAISTVHLFIQRACLGLEPDFEITSEFKLLWNSRFATFYVWQACKRRELYPENYIHIVEHAKGLKTEAFQFLEAQLRESSLTIAQPGSLAYWSPHQDLPTHPRLTVLQASEPATQQLLPVSPPTPEGLNLLGTPERDARQSWLAALNLPLPPDSTAPDIPVLSDKSLPFWIQAAIRLGVQFIRVDAAGIPPASMMFTPRRDPEQDQGCCHECGKSHPPVMDYYYFWLLPSRYFDNIEQDADWGVTTEDTVSDWHRPNALPGLLSWDAQPMVHLVWCRFHNGEISGIWRSDEGVRSESSNQSNRLEYLGREDDSLYFEVTNGQSPIGFDEPREPGFVVHLATQTAEVLPRVVAPEPHDFELDGLLSYPYFAYFAPGAPLVPPTLFSPALAIAGHLLTHCQFEAALKWYECYCEPLQDDLSELWCPSEILEPEPDPTPEPDPDPDPTPEPDPVPEPSNPAVPILLGQASVAEIARKRSLVLHYLEALLQWGDALMRQHSPESFQQARLIFDTACKILGDTPKTVQGVDTADEPQTLEDFEPHAAPLNPRLLCVYDNIEDRLALIRSCINAWRFKNGQPNKHMPYWGDSPFRDCGLTTTAPCLDAGDWCYPHSCYRFDYLIQKALELANEASRMGSALLTAFERGDAEYLATLRETHQRQILNLTLEIHQLQYRAADWEVQALEKAQALAQTRRDYFANLIENGLNSDEISYQTLTGVSTASRAAGNVLEGVAAILRIIPNLETGNVGPLPTTLQLQPLGDKISQASSIGGTIANTVADISSSIASLRLTEGGWVRRDEEWVHQVEIIGIEIEQIERQILAAQRRRDSSLRELNNHQRQLEQAAEIQTFMYEKFTNHALYLWMQEELAALHYQLHECAFHTARQAERAFNYERGYTTRKFITSELWDNLHEALLAGDRLVLALRQMEKAYRDENCREYELTEHFSLRMYFPWAFLQLKLTGYCEIEIPEWLFDHFYPGQYMRRIKNVSLTIPCVVGPYVSVHCRLTLLKSTTRISPYLIDPPTACCAEKQPKNGYVTKPDDPRMVNTYAAKEAIATSSGQSDTGLFELNFRDERYLPFEYTGAVSCWRIELPQENNQFDVDTISDIILHLNYMAREGGEVLREAASEVAQCYLPDQGIRFFDVKDDFPDLWHRSQLDANPPKHHPHYAAHKDHSLPIAKELELRLSRPMFPFLAGRPHLTVHTINLLFKAPGADPSAHHIVQFLPAGLPMDEHHWKCDSITIYCIANADWPGHYHGVLQLETPLGPLSHNNEQHLGTFRFPKDVGIVSQVYLFCGYEVTDTAP